MIQVLCKALIKVESAEWNERAHNLRLKRFNRLYRHFIFEERAYYKNQRIHFQPETLWIYKLYFLFLKLLKKIKEWCFWFFLLLKMKEVWNLWQKNYIVFWKFTQINRYMYWSMSTHFLLPFCDSWKIWRKNKWEKSCVTPPPPLLN